MSLIPSHTTEQGAIEKDRRGREKEEGGGQEEEGAKAPHDLHLAEVGGGGPKYSSSLSSHKGPQG
jgi:hypothetical protein